MNIDNDEIKQWSWIVLAWIVSLSLILLCWKGCRDDHQDKQQAIEHGLNPYKNDN